MTEYRFTLKAILENDRAAGIHLEDLINRHAAPMIGEVWREDANGDRYMIGAYEPPTFLRAQREERALEALRRSGHWSDLSDEYLRRVVRTVLDA